MNRQSLYNLRDRLRTEALPGVKDDCGSVEEMMAAALDLALPKIEAYDGFEEFYEHSRAYFRAIAFSYQDDGIPESAYDSWSDRLRARAKVIYEERQMGVQ